MPGENIQVAVRVRPFSTREISRNTKLIVSMAANTTTVVDPENPKNEPKKFTFDHSYWSHDGFKPNSSGYNEPDDPRYVDQTRVFKDIGVGMLDSAWKGYNCSIFAYGQTGSGKSYSIMGHGPNKGLVPRMCEELFVLIGNNKKEGVNYEVTFSMLEIYNEHVRDLLNKKKTTAHSLTVKESAGKGFYVEGLTVVPVGTYRDIKLRMDEGDRMRTIAATKMNETSSRAHTIVKITFAQNDLKTNSTKTSSINLVDLAGSERAKQTEASGDRFEEAKNINKSLMTLGNVIKALCDKIRGRSTHVPYRDSVLTKLLKNALGGNSKTHMIAAISPDAENYDQTISTLRYADKAKSIKTVATVNQAATDALIKELIAEKERLLRDLENAKKAKTKSLTDEELSEIKHEHEEELLRYKEQMENSELAWKKRLEASRQEMEELMAKEKQAEEEEKKIPHLSNLNEDPALQGKLMHMIKQGSASVGNGKDDTNPEIRLNGPRIAKLHAALENRKGEVFLQPQEGLVLYNGKEITKQIQLQHTDRIRFGSNNLFVFINPVEAAKLRKAHKAIRDITFEFAQNEIAKHSGLNLGEDGILQEEVMTVMQMVQDANAMAEDMDKAAEFNILLVSPEARGLDYGRTEVYVKLQDLDNGNEYLWEKNLFLNRQLYMQEMYESFENTNKVPEVDKEKDPFWEPPDTEVIVGVVSVPLNYLSHMIEFEDDPLLVMDYKANQVGFLKVDLIPCDSKGREDVDLCVEDPMDLVRRSMAFKVRIHQAMNLPENIKESWCKYKFYQGPDVILTEKGRGKNPKYSHERLFRFHKNDVDHKFIDFLREKSMTVEIWGTQGDRQREDSAKTNRREDKQRLKMENEELRSRYEDMERKMREISKIVEKYPDSKGMDKIKAILHN